MKEIVIRGKSFYPDFLLSVDKKYFISLFADKKESVQEAAWQEACKAVGRKDETESSKKKSRKRKKSD